MNFNTGMAKRICADMGIKWNDQLEAPTINGMRFSIEELFRRDANMLEEMHIKRLYELLYKIEKEDPDTASALRWAIFTLEQEVAKISQSR